MKELTKTEIYTTLMVLSQLEEMARLKLDFEKAERYCTQIQKIECDIRHFNEIIKEV